MIIVIVVILYTLITISDMYTLIYSNSTISDDNSNSSDIVYTNYNQ